MRWDAVGVVGVIGEGDTGRKGEGGGGLGMEDLRLAGKIEEEVVGDDMENPAT